MFPLKHFFYIKRIKFSILILSSFFLTLQVWQIQLILFYLNSLLFTFFFLNEKVLKSKIILTFGFWFCTCFRSQAVQNACFLFSLQHKIVCLFVFACVYLLWSIEKCIKCKKSLTKFHLYVFRNGTHVFLEHFIFFTFWVYLSGG